MIESSEDLPFTLKAGQRLAVDHGTSYDLERDLFFEFTVIPLREKDGSHTAASDLADDPIISENLPAVRSAIYLRRQVKCVVLKQIRLVTRGVKQRLDLAEKALVTRRAVAKEFDAVRRREFDHVGE